MTRRSFAFTFCMFVFSVTCASASDRSFYQLVTEAARTAQVNGELPKAEKLRRQALTLSEQGDDPLAANQIDQSRFELAEILKAENKFRDAMALYRKIQQSKEKFYDNSVLDRCIAECEFGLGLHAQSEKSLLAAVTVKRSSNEPDSLQGPDGIRAETLRAVIAMREGDRSVCSQRLKNAIALANSSGQSLPGGRQQSVDPTDIDQVAAWLQKNRCTDSAEIIYKALLESRIKKLTWSNPLTVSTAIKLAECSPDSRKSLPILEQGLKAQVGARGIENKLRLLHARVAFLSSPDAKLSSQLQALELSIGSRRFNDETVQLYYDVTGRLRELGKLEQSVQLTKRMLALCEKYNGLNSHQTADILILSAADAATEKRYDEAASLNAQAIEILQTLKKPERILTIAMMLQNQADYLAHLKEFDKADTCYRRLIAVFEEKHLEVPLLMFLGGYASMLQDAGRTKPAAEVSERIKLIRDKYSDHCGSLGFVDPGTVVKW